MSGNLTKSIQYLKSVGPKRAEAFSKIGIRTIKDLLFYFPTKYLDRSTILNSIKVLQFVRQGYQGEVTIIGKVISKELIKYSRKSIFKIRMKDSTGTFECIWFQSIKYFYDTFNEGDYFAVSAKPVLTKYGHLQFVHPDFDRLSEKESSDFLNTGKIIPFYRVPKELREKNLGDFSLRKIIYQAVEIFADELNETLPEYILKEKNILPINEAIKNIHFPNSNDALNAAKKRIKFEELFYFECLVALRKNLIENRRKSFTIKVKPEPIKKFLNSLPFQLTKAQLKVLHEIRLDLESNKPMNRLLQGDVGSGKTIVALISMLIAVTNGYQAILMAPTEILADQHYKNISKLLKNMNINVCLLIGGQKKSDRERILNDIKNGTAQIIIGTHALIEENVEFNKVALIVIDEQHRFGVLQRSELIKKGLNPDVLVMTATPIPRTLSLTLYGDLEVSIIDEMPANKKPVKTVLRSEKKLPEVYKFIKEKTKEGYQTFLVYPIIEESEKSELKAAESYYKELKENYLYDLRIGLIHGRMKWQEKEKVMLDFAEKKYDVLVSTTVIEVGIDIPDANIIVINDAERFGLAQLHQLRGRVGRGSKQAYCILITKEEFVSKTTQLNFNFEYLSPAQIEKNKTIIRLNSMLIHNNGFELAEIDLKLRGPGDIFGTKQSGLPDLKYSDITEDVDILYEAKEMAFNVIKTDPKLSLEKNFIIKKILKENYSNHLHLSQIA
ncbi:MAG: ATP-dependent DNA helicase RecG [Melioribacter sp.]|nr:ATP-dependent DNA helicase RecG [Melioribacter sp.]